MDDSREKPPRTSPPPRFQGGNPPTDPPARRAAAAAGLDNKVSVFGYLCLYLNVFFFSALIIADPGISNALTREDYWVENLTAVWFLLAGILLFATAWREQSLFRRCVYILGGMAMVLAAGEEISWGQRIFGFATPDFLMSLNEQEESTIHNIANGTFDIIYLNGTLILCMAASAAFFCRKGRLFGIPLPSILLMLGFLAMVSYAEMGYVYESAETFREFIMATRRSFGFVVIEEKGLLLLFFIFALFSRQVQLIIASAATLALVLALSYVNYNHVNYPSNVHVLGSLYEMREYLFGILCLFYSLEILLAQGRIGRIGGMERLSAAISRAPFSRLKLPGGRIPLWLMTCALVIAGSIGLVFFEYFNAMART